ncbi:MAG: nuclear transport factor 2 family protein [Mucilaginibacter sp.]
MMKKIIISCALVFASLILYAQDDKRAILKVLDQQRIAWNNGDIDGYMLGYWHSDSLLFVGSSAPTRGWHATLERYKKHYPGKAAMGALTFTILKVDLLDKTNAFILGAWHLQREKDAPGGYFTLWFRKINGEWKIVVDHTS